MALLFSDDFNRADNTSLGANWTEARDDQTISTNTMRMPVSTSPAVAVTNTSAHAAVANCRVKVKVSTPGSGFDAGPVVRYSAGPNFYAADFVQNGSNIDLGFFRHVGSFTTSTPVGSAFTFAHTMTAGDVLELLAFTQDGNVHLQAILNGALKAEVIDDSGSQITAAGQCGVYKWNNTAATNWDDFEVWSLEATRLYYSTAAAAVTPSFSGLWNAVTTDTANDWKTLKDTKDGTSSAQTQHGAPSSTGNPSNCADLMLVSNSFAAQTLVEGWIKGVWYGLETQNTANATAAYLVRRVQSDGTHIANVTSGIIFNDLQTEFTSSATGESRRAPMLEDGVGVLRFAMQLVPTTFNAGDRLVIEMGAHYQGTSGFPAYWPSNARSDGSDLAENETDTAQTGSGWWEIESPTVISFGAGASPTLEQQGFWFRNDNGSESAATFIGSQNSNITFPSNQNVRLRILVNATGDPSSKQFQLEYRKVGDPTWLVAST
jgi:hypothetical protein